jgi:hypothetical protein
LDEYEVISVRLSRDVKEAWEALAEEHDWEISKLLSFVLKQFIKMDGNIYSGNWKEKGEEKGSKIVIEWPTYPSVITKGGIMSVPSEEMR